MGISRLLRAAAGAALLCPLAVSPSAAATFTVINTHDSAVGSLRWAIDQAGASPGWDRIVFNIPGAGVQTISLLSTLVLATPVGIDGTTQPGYVSFPGIAGKPLIQIDGTSANPGSSAFVVVIAGSSSVRGLAIGNFGGAALDISAPACTVAACHIGCNPAGTAAQPNRNGVAAGSAHNLVVGGPDARSRNVISGNTEFGITTLVSDDMRILGNYIGTNATGTAAIPNGVAGMQIVDSPGCVIGGLGPGSRNLVSGNNGRGISVQSTNPGFGDFAQILGNWVGCNVYGTGKLPNVGTGIDLYARNSSIGSPDAPNVVSGNGQFGIAVGDASNLVWHNFVGTTFDGTQPLGNEFDGIYVVGRNQEISQNVIGGNLGSGIMINSSLFDENLIRGNAIGTNRSGAAHLGNGSFGIACLSSRNLIGGIVPEDANVIAFNFRGIVVHNGDGNSLRRNRVYSNTLLDIDLGNDNVTANDATDSDDGANHLQNFPLISSVTYAGGQLSIAGTLETVPSRSVVIDLFSSPACHPSGNGGGETWVASVQGTTDGAGMLPFNYQTAGFANVAGYYFTATATLLELDGIHSSTSEFSPCAVLAPTVAIDEPSHGRLQNALGPPRPQPARGSLSVPFTLARPAHVTVRAYDAAGRRVATLLDETRSAGRHEVTWSTRDIAPGSYRVRLEGIASDGTGERFTQSRSAIVVR